MTAPAKPAPEQSAVRPEKAPSHRSMLKAVLRAASDLTPAPSGREADLVASLAALAARLAADRFQLSVVGQFKRGKSSLLNALLDADVLPAGVLPLTSVPTFIEAADHFGLTVAFSAADPQAWSPSDADELQAVLRSYVAEDANPRNTKQVERVVLTLASPLLSDGLVLIDTPGVGSTLRHNTDAAEAALPECDAALVVVSPDPPITQVELDYIERVRASAADIIVALNKIDTLEPADVPVAVTFLREVLDGVGLPSVEIFPVSARRARAAEASGDATALDASGIPALRRRLGANAVQDRERLLVEAIAQKTAPVVRELDFENDIAVSALTTPLEVLDQRLAAFRVSAVGFERERRAAADQLQGDRRRLLADLDTDCEALRERLKRTLLAEVGRRTAAGAGSRAAWDEVRQDLPGIFERELEHVTADQRDRLAQILTVHQERADALLAEVRLVAAALLEVSFRAPAGAAAFEIRDRPYWLQQPRETLSSAPASLVERLLPGAFGRRHAAHRVADEIGQVVTANVEHLRWSTRQNLEESLRRFGDDLDRALRDGIAVVTTAVEQARTLRAAGAGAAASVLETRRQRSEDLRRAQCTLELIAAPAGHVT
jgi:hypothetical protein